MPSSFAAVATSTVVDSPAASAQVKSAVMSCAFRGLVRCVRGGQDAYVLVDDEGLRVAEGAGVADVLELEEGAVGDQARAVFVALVAGEQGDGAFHRDQSRGAAGGEHG